MPYESPKIPDINGDLKINIILEELRDFNLDSEYVILISYRCKRMLAAPSMWQSYTAFVYDDGCDNYIEWYTKDVD